MRIKKAINTAYEQHYGQIRKVDKAPYIIHPLEVFSIVSRFTDDEDTRIAALLHDTLEDTSYSASEMEREFGSNVVQLVSLLSENKNLEWKDRKYLYIKRLKESKNKNAILISASDKLNNLASIQYAYRKFGNSVWDCFNAKKEDQVKFYETYLTELSEFMPDLLRESLKEELDAFKVL